MTELVFILDRSGSMSGMEQDTIGGFNSMIGKQKRESGDALPEDPGKDIVFVLDHGGGNKTGTEQGVQPEDQRHGDHQNSTQGHQPEQGTRIRRLQKGVQKHLQNDGDQKIYAGLEQNQKERKQKKGDISFVKLPGEAPAALGGRDHAGIPPNRFLELVYWRPGEKASNCLLSETIQPTVERKQPAESQPVRAVIPHLPGRIGAERFREGQRPSLQ